jgi:hypothetical protein
MTARQYSFVQRTEPLTIISKLRKGNWELAAQKSLSLIGFSRSFQTAQRNRKTGTTLFTTDIIGGNDIAMPKSRSKLWHDPAQLIIIFWSITSTLFLYKWRVYTDQKGNESKL